MKPEDKRNSPNVDHVDPAAADRPPRADAKDRPGFDLGGAVNPTYGGSEGLTNPAGRVPVGGAGGGRDLGDEQQGEADGDTTP